MLVLLKTALNLCNSCRLALSTNTISVIIGLNSADHCLIVHHVNEEQNKLPCLAQILAHQPTEMRTGAGKKEQEG